MKGEIDNSTIIFGYFNITISITDKTTKHKIRKYLIDFKILISQILTSIIEEYIYNRRHTFFSNTNELFSKLDYMLAHKTILNKFVCELSVHIFGPFIQCDLN